MKKNHHPRWPEPVLGMAPIRLRPMGWLDDLLPMRPPSLWRDVSVQRGLQWSPNLAELSWLFAAYSMLGVELPMPRIQHRSHISTSRQPVRRRTNARTLLQQKGSRRQNIAIPSWKRERAVQVSPTIQSERRVEHARLAQAQKRVSLSPSNVPSFQWKGEGVVRPQTTSSSNLQLVKRIIAQEESTLRPSRSTETTEIISRKNRGVQRKTDGATAKQWTLKPSSRLRLPQGSETIALQRAVLHPLRSLIRQEIEQETRRKSSIDPISVDPRRTKNKASRTSISPQKRKPIQAVSTQAISTLRFALPTREDERRVPPKRKYSLSPPQNRTQREWLRKSVIDEKKNTLRTGLQESTTAPRNKRSSNVSEPALISSKRREAQRFLPDAPQQKGQATVEQTEQKRLRRPLRFFSADRIQSFRFSVPDTSETVQPKRVRPQFSLAPLPLLRKEEIPDSQEERRTKPKNKKQTSDPISAQKRTKSTTNQDVLRKKTSVSAVVPQDIANVRFSIPSAPITKIRPKLKGQISLSPPKTIVVTKQEEERVDRRSRQRASDLPLQTVLRKRAAQIFQREEIFKVRSQRERMERPIGQKSVSSALLTPQQRSNREDISWTQEEKTRSVQPPSLSTPVLLRKNTDNISSEALPPVKKKSGSGAVEIENRRASSQGLRPPSQPILPKKKFVKKEEEYRQSPKNLRDISVAFDNIRKIKKEEEPLIKRFSVRDAQIVRALRRRKETSLQLVPPIFEQTKGLSLRAEASVEQRQQSRVAVDTTDLPIVSKRLNLQPEEGAKPRRSKLPEKEAPLFVRSQKEQPQPSESSKPRVSPEVIAQLKRIRAYSFRDAPQFSQKRKQFLRDLRNVEQIRRTPSVQAIERELQIVRREQAREERLQQKKQLSAPTSSVQVRKRGSLFQPVVWPSRSTSKLLRHIEEQKRRIAQRKSVAAETVPQELRNFFTAPSTGTPQKRTQSPLLSLQSGTLVFPTPELSVDSRPISRRVDVQEAVDSTPKKRQPSAALPQSKVKEKRVFPLSYVAQKSVYRRAFSATGTRGRLQVGRWQEKESITKAPSKKRIPTLVQTSLAWRAVWVETEQAPKRSRTEPEKERIAQVSGLKFRDVAEPKTRQKQTETQTSLTNDVSETRVLKPQQKTRSIGRYTGLNREAAVFWTRERSVSAPSVVLQALRKQGADALQNEVSRKKIALHSEIQAQKKRRIGTDGERPDLSSRKRVSKAREKVQFKQRGRVPHSIQELNWKPKRLIVEEPLIPAARSEKKETPQSSSPSNRKQQNVPVIENWRRAPSFSNPFVSIPTAKRKILGTERPEMVRARSLSSNIVFQPSPKAYRVNQEGEQLPPKSKSIVTESGTVSQQRVLQETAPKEGSTSSRVKSAEVRSPLRKRARNFLRPDMSLPSRFLSSNLGGGRDPKQVSATSRVVSRQEREVQFYRQAQQQTFLRPEQRPLDIQQIESAEASTYSLGQKRSSSDGNRMTRSGVVERGIAPRNLLSRRVFQAMQQVVRPTKLITPSAQVERNLSRTSGLESGFSTADSMSVGTNQTRNAVTMKGPAKKTRTLISPVQNPRQSILSRTQTRPQNSFPRAILPSVSEETYVVPEQMDEPTTYASGSKTQQEQEIELVQRKRRVSSNRKPIAPRAVLPGKEIGVFLRPKKQVVVEEEEVREKPKGLRIDQVSKNADLFFIDPSGNLLQGEKAKKKMKELGYVRSESKVETPSSSETKGLPTSYSWEASPEVLEQAIAEVQRQVQKEEKPKKIQKKVESKRVISEMTEEELFIILTALVDSSAEAQELLRDVRMRVEEYFDYERFRKI